MSIESFCIIQNEGEIIMQRDYTVKTPTTDLLTLRNQVMSGSIKQPVFSLNNHIYAHNKFSVFNLFAQIGAQSDAMAAVFFLEQIHEIIVTYYSDKVKSDDIRCTQIWFEQMLDQVVDNGEIVTTDPEVLDLFLTKQTQKKDEEKLQITIEATKQLNYREPNIFYKSNQIDLRLREKINSLFANTGEVLEQDVKGQIDINCRLSGMPDCQLSLNDRQMQKQAGPSLLKTNQIAAASQVALDDVWFHNCVKLSNFAEKRQITFCPPDGQFTVMNYRISEGVRAPVVVKGQFDAFGRQRARAKFTASLNLPESAICSKLRVQIPMPINCESCTITSIKQGQAKLRKTGDFVTWNVGTLQKGVIGELEIEINTTIAEGEDLREWKRTPLRCEFEIPMYAASGVEIREFSVNMGNVQAEVQKKLSTVTESGNYFCRW